MLAESGAIVEELLDHFDPDGLLRPPPGTEAHRRYRYFLHYAEGSLMTPLVVALLTGRLRKAKLPFFVRPVVAKVADGIDDQYTRGEVEAHFSFLDAHLGAHDWFAGEAFTAADVQMSYGLLAALARGGVGNRPNLERWVAQVEERPAFQRAVDRGGPPLPPG
jgi:glutathione S-transferase